MFCDTLKSACKETEIKLSLRSFEAISKGCQSDDANQNKLGKKYAQPIVAQLFGEARRTVENARGSYNQKWVVFGWFYFQYYFRYDDSVRMVGLCCSDAYDFNIDR